MSRVKVISTFLLLIILGLAIYYWYPEPELTGRLTINRLVVMKSERQLLAYSNDKLVKTYCISLGHEPEGHKAFKGDNRTPEGIYVINDKNPNSGYYKNLGISYPNADDRSKAASADKSPGGDVKIHGLKNGLGLIGKFHRWMDWTQGCIAVTNEEMDELYDHTPVGAVIEIRP